VFDTERDALFPGRFAEGIVYGIHKSDHVVARQRQLFAFIFNAPKIKQLVNQLNQVNGTFMNEMQLLEQGLIGGFADNGFQRREDQRERCPELMTYVREKLHFKLVKFGSFLVDLCFLFPPHFPLVLTDLPG